ncbi:MAG TPA: HD domain-containing phosphohydrolase [Blastocatellia bacterium]|nr:HD domain-containing phosphohydrolase [Blastocatellia bacterium]
MGTGEKATGENVRRCYQLTVTVTGLSLCVLAGANIALLYERTDQLIVLALISLALLVGAFPQNFKLPVGLGFTQEVITFTLTDAIVIIVACCYGPYPAILMAGIESFVSARRGGPLLSSHLFSSAMMSLSAAAASLVLSVGLYSISGEAGPGVNQNLAAAAISMFLASIAHFAVNAVLLSMLIALRHGRSIRRSCKDFLWAAPMFLPTGTAASLIYAALQIDLLVMVAIGGPTLLTIFLAHRQYRDGISKRIAVMDKGHRETIEALAVAINAKDEVTHEHVLRVQIYAAGVARILGCSDSEIEALRAGALLHDIGKIAVPDYILNKPGKLTAAEFEKMKFHTIAGAQILGRVEFPYPVVPVVRYHHERWDGQGYPDGLSGESIPLTARILSVVDCFDAVREDRQYRKGMTREEAIELLIQGSGKQYDPHVVGTFIAHLGEYEAEIKAHRNVPVPTFGIEAREQLSAAARLVAPAAGLAEECEDNPAGKGKPIHNEVKAICALARAMMWLQSQERTLAAFTDKLRGLVPYDLCAITLVVPKTGQNEVVHAAGRHSQLVKGRNIALGEGVTGWVIANGKPFCNTDPKLDLPPQFAEQLSEYSTLAVFPIVNERSIYGAVTLYSSTLLAYTAEHQSLMKEAVGMITSALLIASEAGAAYTPPVLDSSSELLAGIELESELTQ